MGQVVLQDQPDGFQNAADAALVVAAQDGGAVGVDDAAADLRLDPVAGDHGVHVGGEHHGLPLAGQTGEDVEAVGVVGLARLVGDGLQPQLLQHLAQALAHGLLVAALAVDLYELQKFLEQPLLVDLNHGVCSPFISAAIAAY